MRSEIYIAAILDVKVPSFSSLFPGINGLKTLIREQFNLTNSIVHFIRFQIPDRFQLLTHIRDERLELSGTGLHLDGEGAAAFDHLIHLFL